MRSRSAHAQRIIQILCLVFYLPFRKSQSVFSYSCHEYNQNKALLEPHLDVREQGLYGGQAFREDEGSVVETCWELLSRRVRKPLAALPAWWGFLVHLSVTGIPGRVSSQRAVICRVWKETHGEELVNIPTAKSVLKVYFLIHRREIFISLFFFF